MKLYKIDEDKVVNINFITDKGIQMVSRLSEQELNDLGYLLVDDSNFEQDTYYVYYRQVPSVYGNRCIIKYYLEERSVEEVKTSFTGLLLNNTSVDNAEDYFNKKTLIDNCVTIDDLKNITGKEIDVVMSTNTDILKAIDVYYGVEEEATVTELSRDIQVEDFEIVSDSEQSDDADGVVDRRILEVPVFINGESDFIIDVLR